MHSHSAKSPKYGDISRWLTPAKSLVMFESRSGARGVRLARSSCAAPDGFIQPKEAIGWRGRGRLLLVTFLGEARKVIDGTTSHLTNPANDAG